jgi:hypothetical protein
MVTRRLHRVVVLLAGVTGLLALFGEPAQGIGGHQHCEPLR